MQLKPRKMCKRRKKKLMCCFFSLVFLFLSNPGANIIYFGRFLYFDSFHFRQYFSVVNPSIYTNIPSHFDRNEMNIKTNKIDVNTGCGYLTMQ